MVILLGGTGYVGQAFSAMLRSKNVPFVSASRQSCDYTEPGNLSALLRDNRATFVVNCAGFTGKPNVDACEEHKLECLKGNALLPGVIKGVCDDLKIAWGHVSSGCIFIGHRGISGSDESVSGFTELDAPNFSFRQNNCSFYSGTKALGEEILGYQEVRKSDGSKIWENRGEDTGYIWRLRIPFNEIASPRNFLSKLMSYDRLLDARNSLSQLDEFVLACWECRERAIPFGVYNMTNPGSITTRDVVGLILNSPLGNEMKSMGKQFQFFKDEGEFMKSAAVAPRSNCILDTKKLSSYGITMTPVEEAVEKALFAWNGRKTSRNILT